MPMLPRAPLVLVGLLLALAGGGCREPALFERLPASETGVTFANTITEDDSLHNPLRFDYVYNGGGVAVGDVDGDGRPDLYFTGTMVSSRLYLNRGGFRFEDVTERAGVGTTGMATGAAMADVNGDGRLDLYVCRAGVVPEAERANRLFVNQGPGADGVPRFAESATAYGVADTGFSTHAAFFDYDRDGDLDLYVLTNAHEHVNKNAVRRRLTNGEHPSTDRLYRNDGDGTFTDVSREAGILVEGYGLGLAVTDLNDDGWPDVYVANDFLTNDLLWVNNGDGTFTDRAAVYLKHQSQSSMGMDAADVDNDGRTDLFVLDMLPPTNARRKVMLPAASYDVFQAALDHGYAPQYVRNMLQLNRGPGPDGHPVFSEVGRLAGVEATDWSWAPLFADFDNDGDRDLFISNGYRRDVTNLDFIVFSYRVSMMGTEASKARRLFTALDTIPEVKLSNHLFVNEGGLAFTDRAPAWGLAEPGFSNGSAVADLDGDGDLDLVTNNVDGEAFVYRNGAERLADRHTLRVAFEGPPGNRGGFGAKVTIRYGGRLQYQDFSPFRGYVSTVEPIVHFGLGPTEQVDSLEVVWPDGAYQLLTGVRADQVVTVRHADAAPRPPTRAAPGPPPLLADVTGAYGPVYRHEEEVVVDFDETPLLPHRLSTFGPGLAVGDVDGDGRDDVYVGADGARPRTMWMQRTPGRFEPVALGGAPPAADDMGALFFDADRDGDLDLYVVAGGAYPSGRRTPRSSGVIAYRVAGTGGQGPERYQDRLYLNEGGVLLAAPDALPPMPTSGSAVAAGDYDADGDADLFVGGRLVPGAYPLPPRSYLLRNDARGGTVRFVDVTGTVAPGLAEAGMVTTALWTDFDQDGRLDLVAAGEWMPLTFFRQSGGRFTDATDRTGLGDTRGWWNSLAGGDFDDDGDVDYVAGNAGRNAGYRPSPDEPLRLYAADFDHNGSVDPVLTHYVGGEPYIAAPRDLLLEQIPGMERRFASYTAYAGATVDRSLTDDERETAYLARSVTFESSYLENRGGGRFVRRPLPVEAQFAPVFGMLVDDFDHDGRLDLLTAGNFYGPDPQTGRYDASTGALFAGDGTGGLAFVPYARSGFFVDGDARGLAEVAVGDTASLVLAAQNDDGLKVFARSAARAVRLRPGDRYALLTLASGAVRRQELYDGAAYLSQSSRVLRVPRGARVVVVDAAGRQRRLGP